MNYYDYLDNILEYTRKSSEQPGLALINILSTFLVENSSVLELGMGPGHDLVNLTKFYRATGSDKSSAFLERYKEKDSNTPLLVLDATELKTNRNFDAIYSNKVLHHLYREELKASIKQQTTILNTGGLIAHSFWAGNREEDYLDLHFVYYKISEIRALFDPYFSILHLAKYSEKSSNDSIFVIGEKRQFPLPS